MDKLQYSQVTPIAKILLKHPESLVLKEALLKLTIKHARNLNFEDLRLARAAYKKVCSDIEYLEFQKDLVKKLTMEVPNTRVLQQTELLLQCDLLSASVQTPEVVEAK